MWVECAVAREGQVTGVWRRCTRSILRRTSPGVEQTRTAAGGDQPVRFTVWVDDNFAYMDETERYALGSFDTLEQAVRHCQARVDGFLVSHYQPGMSAAELYAAYTSFGEDPFILPRTGAQPFSAWQYAKQRCETLCAPPGPR